MTTQDTHDDTDSAAQASEWPELEKLVADVKTKRAEELARQEEQRTRAQKAQQDAEKAWETLRAQASLDDLAEKLGELGVTARTTETVAGANSAALELSRLPKGETAIIRVDTSPSRSGPPRTTIQVQRGTQQLSPTTLNVNTNSELRKQLIEIAQKLLG
ncbi:MAG TPA: hypothetical protein VKV26_08840 [Dehalococcoidia bacterium]|nr:hypothetical protein [Dehalococcoidia bacterium]